jgi:hypothetical protein
VYGGEGLIAEGRKNLWICQLGREKVDGPFREWTQKVAAAPLEATEASVKYRAPGVGEASFAWDGPLRVNGRPVALGDYDRFDNPYCKAKYGSGRYDIAAGGYRLRIDFAKGEHSETVPRVARPRGARP